MDHLFDMMLPVFVDYLGCFEEGIEGVNSPPDVMRELHQRGVQESKFLPGGELAIEEDQLVLRDSPQRIVAERFDLRHLDDPVGFVKKNARMEEEQGFTRVVVFRETQRSGHFDSKARFHAVQCIDSNPNELVDMIKLAKDKYVSNGHQGRMALRQSSQNSLDSNWMMASEVSSVVNLRKKQTAVSGSDSVRSATIRRSGAPSRGTLPFRDDTIVPVLTPTPPPKIKSNHHKKVEKKPSIPLVTDQTAGALGFERPSFQYSISEDPVQKDTILLNYCIDDIERFCAELKMHKLPAASEDIRGPNVSRRHNEPRAIDFVNIFQKFKLAFNLLGRLEEFLENPTAAEMLHHLFPPLAFLVDECFDLFDEDLVRDVVYPLPTPKAVNLLERRLGQREAVIWRALGENWLNPNIRQAHEIVPYSPRFHDGWSPGVISFSFPDETDTASKRKSVTSNGTFSSEEVGVAASSPLRRTSSNRHSVVSSNEDFDAYRDELMAMGSKIGLVTASRKAQSIKELSTVRGEYLEIVNDSKNWWRCINADGQAGFVPCNFMKVISYTDGENYRQAGPQIATTSSQPPMSSSSHSRKSSSKKRKPSMNAAAAASGGATSRLQRQESTSSDSNEVAMALPPTPMPSIIPPPPPPQPQLNHHHPVLIRPTATSQQQRPSRLGNDTMRSGISMQEELRSVLDLMISDDKALEIKTTPDVYITQNSTQREVKQWLRDKEFSPRAVEKLSRLTGSQLFAMSRKDLIAAFGKQEGIRLDSQITISRNSAGYQTAKTSELRDILAKARQRTENAREQDTSVA